MQWIKNNPIFVSIMASLVAILALGVGTYGYLQMAKAKKVSQKQKAQKQEKEAEQNKKNNSTESKKNKKEQASADKKNNIDTKEAKTASKSEEKNKEKKTENHSVSASVHDPLHSKPGVQFEVANPKASGINKLRFVKRINKFCKSKHAIDMICEQTQMIKETNPVEFIKNKVDDRVAGSIYASPSQKHIDYILATKLKDQESINLKSVLKRGFIHDDSNKAVSLTKKQVQKQPYYIVESSETDNRKDKNQMKSKNLTKTEQATNTTTEVGVVDDVLVMAITLGDKGGAFKRAYNRINQEKAPAKLFKTLPESLRFRFRMNPQFAVKAAQTQMEVQKGVKPDTNKQDRQGDIEKLSEVFSQYKRIFGKGGFGEGVFNLMARSEYHKPQNGNGMEKFMLDDRLSSKTLMLIQKQLGSKERDSLVNSVAPLLPFDNVNKSKLKSWFGTSFGAGVELNPAYFKALKGNKNPTEITNPPILLALELSVNNEKEMRKRLDKLAQKQRSFLAKKSKNRYVLKRFSMLALAQRMVDVSLYNKVGLTLTDGKLLVTNDINRFTNEYNTTPLRQSTTFKQYELANRQQFGTFFLADFAPLMRTVTSPSLTPIFAKYAQNSAVRKKLCDMDDKCSSPSNLDVQKAIKKYQSGLGTVYDKMPGYVLYTHGNTNYSSIRMKGAGSTVFGASVALYSGSSMMSILMPSAPASVKDGSRSAKFKKSPSTPPMQQ